MKLSRGARRNLFNSFLSVSQRFYFNLHEIVYLMFVPTNSTQGAAADSKTTNSSSYKTLLYVYSSLHPPSPKTQSRTAMSNPNCLLSQKLCHYLNQGHTLNDTLLRAAHSIAYCDLSKLNLASANIFKVFKF